MARIGHINASWTPEARDALERALLHANVAGAVLALFKSDDGGSDAQRWSYTVYPGERMQPLRVAMEARGHALLHALDGLTVAVSNLNDLRDLDGRVLDLDGPGYLFARVPTPAT